jgi:Fe-S-cluster containining protein
MSILTNGSTKSNGRVLRVLFNCDKCPAYCCSYERIEITRRDLQRLAKHFGLDDERAEKKLTKIAMGTRVLRHKKDHIFNSVCMFLDAETRRCTVYDARPGLCRTYPGTIRCGYYDFLSSERRRQQDDEFIPSA